MHTAESLTAQLADLGVRSGDHLMLHVSLRRVGAVEGGPEALLRALDTAVGPTGTLMMVLGAEGFGEWVDGEPDAATVEQLEPHQFFNALETPAMSDIGWFAEVFRRAGGTVVSDHPEGRFGARGRLANDFVSNVPWHEYYGAGSPLERLLQAGGRVLRLGADLNTVTLLHYAEFLVPMADKRRVRRYVALGGDQPRITYVDTIDDSDGIVEWSGEDYFTLIMRDYLDTGRARRGDVGNAPSELIEAADLVPFGVEWMTRMFMPNQ